MDKTKEHIWAEKKLGREVERTPDGLNLIFYSDELEKLTKSNPWWLVFSIVVGIVSANLIIFLIK